MLVTSAAVGAAGSVRAGAAVSELAVRRTPTLVVLGVRATVGTGAEAARAQAVFRDELLSLLDDAAEIAWLRARVARDQLGLRTGPPQAGLGATARGNAVSQEPNGHLRRHHRVKA